MWTAPELLRMQHRPQEGTQKGDVYSFAIICQEIVYRYGVYYLSNIDLSPEGKKILSFAHACMYINVYYVCGNVL